MATAAFAQGTDTAKPRLNHLLKPGGRPFIVGHRGASASYPENTLLSFEQAIADGAEAIEFDIQKTLDNEVIILHDSTLDRTTTGSGTVAQKAYHGDLEHVKTKQEPNCPLPLFHEVIDLLFKEQHLHVWGVIDVKVDLPPSILKLLAEILRKRNPDLRVFSNRIMIGLWHPKFIPSAREHLPEIPILHIGQSTLFARKYFSDADGYNLLFLTLVGRNGRKFIDDVHKAGKPVFVWTVNKEPYAKDCRAWGVDAIMTDKPKFFLNYYGSDRSKSPDSWFSTTLRNIFYSLVTWFIDFMAPRYLVKYGQLD